jgi:hypothetical protein
MTALLLDVNIPDAVPAEINVPAGSDRTVRVLMPPSRTICGPTCVTPPSPDIIRS